MPGRKLGADGEIQLSEKQELFLDWLTGARPEGETHEQFGERVGVAPRTLRAWKKDPAFLRRWEIRMRETHAHPDILSKQLAVLNARALAGSEKAIELYWKLVDRMTPDRIEHVDSTTVSDLSDEKLEELYREAVQGERDRRLKAVE